MTNPEKVISVPDPDQARQKATMKKFETDYIDTIGQKIDLGMTDHQPYLQQDFNLAQLSVLIKIPAHHLAWYFKEIKCQSFTDFRNEWRIRHARMMIEQGKNSGMTLEAIGIQSGFLSRNAFLNAFKKHEGTTPSVFAHRFRG
jgi:AraC-like DNA-binding protein